jgi:hypothetical protein
VQGPEVSLTDCTKLFFFQGLFAFVIMSTSDWGNLQASFDASTPIVTRTLHNVDFIGGEPEGVALFSEPSQAPTSKPSPKLDGTLVSVVWVRLGAGKDVCGGKISNSTARFCSLVCMEGTASCGKYASHVKKAEGVVPGFYINTLKEGVAFVQPSVLPLEGGFSDVARNAMKGRRSVTEWTEIFRVVSGFENYSPEAQVQVLNRVARKTLMGPTPMKLKRSMEDVDVESVMLSDSWSDTAVDPLASALLEETGNLVPTEALSFLLVHWNQVVNGVKDGARRFKEHAVNAADFMEEVDNKVVKLIATVGDPPSDPPAPDLWSSVTMAIATSSAQEQRLSGYADTMKHCERVIVQVKEELDTKLNIVGSQVVGIKNELAQQVLPLVTGLVQRVSGGVAGGQENTAVLTQNMIQMEQRMLAMSEELMRMKANSQAGTNTGGLEGMTLESLAMEVGVLKDKVHKVDKENIKLRQDLSTENIVFGTHVFPSKSSYIDFVQVHVEGGYFGFCIDFISILEGHTDSGLNHNERMKNLRTLFSTKFDDLESSRIDLSFKTLIPDVLGKEQDPKDPSKKMEKLTSMEVWEHPSAQAGLKVDLNNFITNVSLSVSSQIESKFGIGTNTSSFFLLMVSRTVTFWNQLDTWITRFEREITTQNSGDDPAIHKSTTWKLICWMLHAMFKEFQVRRQPGQAFSATSAELTKSEKQAKCASIIQGTLGAHQFMTELIRDNFVRHPIFASTMDEFLLRNKASHGTVSDLVKRIKALEIKTTGIQANVDRAAANNAKKGGNGSPK